MKKSRKMVSRKDAAEFLKCSLQTVTNYVESGLLKGHVINGRLFVDGDTLSAIADTAKELEESKRKFAETLERHEEAVRELSDEVDRKRDELFLFNHSAVSKITRDAIKSVILSYGDLMPNIAKDVLADVINYGNIDSTARRFDMEVSSVIRIANHACRTIGSARYDKKVKENDRLKRRIAELELENRNLRNGVSYDKSNDVELMQTRICKCDLSVRTINCLKCMGIETVGDLMGASLSEISKFRNVGRKTIAELEEFSRANGFELK